MYLLDTMSEITARKQNFRRMGLPTPFVCDLLDRR